MNQRSKQIQIFPRQGIPNLSSIFENGVEIQLGEHRDFRREPNLRAFLPEEGRTSLSWTALDPGETLFAHQHPTASMIVVCKGSGHLIGDRQAPLAEGDVVAIPATATHGFRASATERLECLSIQFEGKGLYEDLAAPRVHFGDRLAAIKGTNEERLRQHVTSPFFRLLDDGTLKSERRYAHFVSLLKRWSAHFQTILHTRTAFTRNPEYAKIFLQHLKEEFGHDTLLAGQTSTDPVVEACATWFTHRMMTSSDAERLVIVHMVLETSAHEFHERAALINADASARSYFELHATHDESHAGMGLELLDTLPDAQLKRAHRALIEAWDTLEAMLSRMNELIRGTSA